MLPSQAFKALLERQQVRTNSELADLLYSDFDGVSPSVMVTVIN